jgi:leucyl aminopeptidase
MRARPDDAESEHVPSACMTAPELSRSSDPVTASDADVVLLAARPGEDGPELLAPDAYGWVTPLLVRLGAKGAADEFTRIPSQGDGPQVVAVVGLGDRADAAGLRLAAGTAVRQLSGTEAVAIAVPVDDADAAEALLEGAGLGAYAFSAYRAEAKSPVQRITFHGDLDDARLARVRSVVAGVARTKDLVNTPPADLSPERFAQLAVEAADARASPRGSGTRTSSRPTASAASSASDAGRAAARGSVRLEYAPAAASVHLALVGKGITFDSGGLSLKPGASMVGMKSDMAGAAAVLSAIVALAELQVPVRVTGWLCLAENMPSGTAIRPNDVLRIHGGTTVEVLNTDAEGRLVMADALAAASDEQPDAIIDVATLTGAQLVALGHRIAGLMGDDALVERVRIAAAGEVDEAVWPMPLPRDLMALLKSDVADLANTKLGMTVPGMLLAGVFLREFVGTRTDSDERIPVGPPRHRGPRIQHRRRLGIHRIGGHGRGRSHARPAGRGPLCRVVRSYGRDRRPYSLPPDHHRAAVRVADRLRKGDCGCPSRTLTLSSSVAAAEGTQRRCVPSSWASPSAWSRRTSWVARVCTADASRPRPCCTRPRSRTTPVSRRGSASAPPSRASTSRRHDLPREHRVEQVQGPAGAREGPRHHRHPGRGPPGRTRCGAGRRRPHRRQERHPRHRLLLAVAARPRDRRPRDHQRARPRARLRARQGRRARRRRHRRGVRERLEVLRRRGHDHRGTPPPRPNEEESVSKQLERAFRKRGIEYKLGTRFQGVTQDDNGVVVTLENGETVEAELLLVAVGRGPVTHGLGYEEVGVTMDRGFVITDERLATNIPASTPWATSSPACSSRTAGSSRASSSPRRSRA